MLNLNARRAAGMTLVEMMVGIVVGLIVLWGMSTVYVNSTRSSRTTTTANQLNQDLRAVMDIMVNDIRRAGYWAGATNAANPFTQATTNIQISPLVANVADCILYSYDATHTEISPGVPNQQGVADAGIDFAGFQLVGGVVQTLSPAAALADTTTGCANTQWQNLTDERAITVTQLTFDTVGSKCISFDPATYSAANPATYVSWTTTGGVAPACNATVANGAPATAPPITDTRIETRRINITLTANAISDSSLSRTLSETVLVRNNRITP